MTAIDRRLGVYGDVAIKSPCLVATTANITLSGLQTIDGVVLVADDRVLVKDQTTATENGIYVADTGTWSRALDFNGTRDIVQGSLVFVVSGTTYAQTLWQVSTTSPVIGTSSLTISLLGGSALALASAYSVGTWAALLALSDRPSLVSMSGYHTATDGGGGLFYWKSGDATTAINGLIGNPTSGAAGRYFRIYSGDINVQWTGAKCDSGPTGTGSTDDAAAIQVALDAIPTGGGGIFIPGWSRVGSALSLTKSNVTISGVNGWSSGFVTTSGTADVFTCASELANVNFRDFGVWSTVTKSAGNVFTCPKAARFKFERILAGDRSRVSADGARLYRIFVAAGLDDCTIDGCTFAGAQQQGVLVTGVGNYASELHIGGGSRIANCNIGVHFAGNFGGGYLDRVSIDGNTKNVVIDQSVVATINREFFIDSQCNIDSCSDTGLEIGADGAAYVSADTAWISSAGQYGVASGNQANLFVHATNAALLLNLNHTRIFNSTGSGAIIGAGNIQADGVQCSDNGVYGIDLGAAVVECNAMGGRFGGNNVSGDIRIHASITDYNLQGVAFLSSIKLANVPTLSTRKRIRDCPGVITENSGTGSIASGATTAVITHGLSLTPAGKDINITFLEQGTNDYGRWWVSTITSTQFTLNVSADPGASNLDFAWNARVI